MEKRILILFMMVTLAVSAFAQPTTITCQCILLDNCGNAITQINVPIAFAI
jgi:hypothetical protein